MFFAVTKTFLIFATLASSCHLGPMNSQVREVGDLVEQSYTQRVSIIFDMSLDLPELPDTLKSLSFCTDSIMDKCKQRTVSKTHEEAEVCSYCQVYAELLKTAKIDPFKSEELVERRRLALAGEMFLANTVLSTIGFGHQQTEVNTLKTKISSITRLLTQEGFEIVALNQSLVAVIRATKENSELISELTNSALAELSSFSEEAFNPVVKDLDLKDRLGREAEYSLKSEFIQFFKEKRDEVVNRYQSQLDAIAPVLQGHLLSKLISRSDLRSKLESLESLADKRLHFPLNLFSRDIDKAISASKVVYANVFSDSEDKLRKVLSLVVEFPAVSTANEVKLYRVQSLPFMFDPIGTDKSLMRLQLQKPFVAVKARDVRKEEKLQYMLLDWDEVESVAPGEFRLKGKGVFETYGENSECEAAIALDPDSIPKRCASHMQLETSRRHAYSIDGSACYLLMPHAQYFIETCTDEETTSNIFPISAKKTSILRPECGCSYNLFGKATLQRTLQSCNFASVDVEPRSLAPAADVNFTAISEAIDSLVRNVVPQGAALEAHEIRQLGVEAVRRAMMSNQTVRDLEENLSAILRERFSKATKKASSSSEKKDLGFFERPSIAYSLGLIACSFTVTILILCCVVCHLKLSFISINDRRFNLVKPETNTTQLETVCFD